MAPEIIAQSAASHSNHFNQIEFLHGTGYCGYLIVGLYHRSRTHLSLDKDAPKFRPVQDLQAGRIIQIREVGGLHHRYERVAA
jgi:hypothetical protein